MRKESITWFIPFMEELQPILYWLHRPVPADAAPIYFRSLHELVFLLEGHTEANLHPLVSGTELLLRILCFRPFFVSCQHPGYCFNKFCTAVYHYQLYFEQVSSPLFSTRLSSVEASLRPYDELSAVLFPAFQQWSARMENARSEHAAWVHFSKALLFHLDAQEHAGDFVEIGANVQQPVYALLASLLAGGFRLELPAAGSSLVEDCWKKCQPAWSQLCP